LVLISYSAGWEAFGATAVFAIGITYFWPTMLGYVSEYLPRTGALGLSIMGGAGMLTVSFILPLMGNVYDHQIVAALPRTVEPTVIFQALEGSKEFVLLTQAKLAAGSQTLRYVAALPVLLTAAFLYLRLRTQQTEKL
jgi:hypothetical protein